MNSGRVLEHIINNVLDNECFKIQEENYLDMKDDDRREFEDNRLKILTLERAVLAMLPKDGQDLYDELEALSATNLAITERYMFKKGVILGLTDLEYLKEAGTCTYLPTLKI